MDTPHNFSSMWHGKYRAGGDEKLNINFMWSYLILQPFAGVVTFVIVFMHICALPALLNVITRS